MHASGRGWPREARVIKIMTNNDWLEELEKHGMPPGWISIHPGEDEK